jgi:hypothetical protein
MKLRGESNGLHEDEFILGLEEFLWTSSNHPGAPIVFPLADLGLFGDSRLVSSLEAVAPERNRPSRGRGVQFRAGTDKKPVSPSPEVSALSAAGVGSENPGPLTLKVNGDGSLSGLRNPPVPDADRAMLTWEPGDRLFLRWRLVRTLRKLLEQGHPLVAVVGSDGDISFAHAVLSTTELAADCLVLGSENEPPSGVFRRVEDSLKEWMNAGALLFVTLQSDTLKILSGREFFGVVSGTREPKQSPSSDGLHPSFWRFAIDVVSPQVFRSASMGGLDRVALSFGAPFAHAFGEFITSRCPPSDNTVVVARAGLKRWLHEGPVQALRAQVRELPTLQDLRAASFSIGYFGSLGRFLLPEGTKVFRIRDVTNLFGGEIGDQMLIDLAEHHPDLRSVWIREDIGELEALLRELSCDLLVKHGQLVWERVEAHFMEVLDQADTLAVVELRSDGETAGLVKRLVDAHKLDLQVKLVAVSMAPSARRVILDSGNWEVFLGGPFSGEYEALLAYWGTLLFEGFLTESSVSQNEILDGVEGWTPGVLDGLLYFTEVFRDYLSQSGSSPRGEPNRADVFEAIERFTLNARVDEAQSLSIFFAKAVKEFVRVGPKALLAGEHFSLLDLPFVPPLQQQIDSSIMSEVEWAKVRSLCEVAAAVEDFSLLGSA